MQYGSIPGIDKKVSRLVQGTVMIGSMEPTEVSTLLDAVTEHGCTTFDTAHGYGGGSCERALGVWLAERGNREDVVILGKGCHHNGDRQRVTPFDLTSDLHDSLARMKVDYIDLYVLHRDDPSVPVGPIVDVLNEHVKSGKINAFGGSNWSPERIAEANEYAKVNGLIGLAVSSPNYSMAEQIKEPWDNCVTLSGAQGEAARKWYADTQMPLFTWSSLAGGFFSGRFTPDNLDTFETYLDKLCVEVYCSEENFKRLDRAKQLAAEKGVTLPQIALAYVMDQPMNIFALVGCGNGEEFAQNVEAIGLALTDAELAWLDLRQDEKP